MASPPVVPRSSVWPSGSASASVLIPSVWPAPGRLSTTTAWPSEADSCSAITRASTSGELPAAVATMSLTGLLGYTAGSPANVDAPKVGAECPNGARSVLCGGRSVMSVPTAIGPNGATE